MDHIILIHPSEQFTTLWAVQDSSTLSFAFGVKVTGSSSDNQQFSEHFTPLQPPIQQTPTNLGNQPTPRAFYTHRYGPCVSFTPPLELWNISTTILPFTMHFSPPLTSYTLQQLVSKYSYSSDTFLFEGPRIGNYGQIGPSLPQSLASSLPLSISTQSCYIAGSRALLPSWETI